ncbi:hypothetical protein IscW_ISCW005080 [Ixodes scapularis]|uniref:TRAF-type domain-containing protein n=1 Tax=Ixodes scapularis TaxID=6945 RepID=B7PHY1_IXOSC|nr:hypothetical protein IscW_ISCW005080 [Ixodes scapularis]|eukprot:XP_002403795.1 hypothetical protein IscW_ISCW005080 [Ixodes scapularis]
MPDCSTFWVSGFGKGLEMRPMNFQSPVPNFYVCSFCRVFCWNAPNGCAFSGTCMDVLQHFEQDCGFHSTSCPNCDALVLRDDVVEHLKSECAARVVQRSRRRHPELQSPREQGGVGAKREFVPSDRKGHWVRPTVQCPV